MRSLVVVALTVVADACSAPVRAPNSPSTSFYHFLVGKVNAMAPTLIDEAP